MANIHAQARSGTLTSDSLEAFLKADPSVIDLPSGPKGLTPLAAACYAGHFKAVKLLLENYANVDTPSSKNRTPLLFATFHPKRLAIVRLLLDFGADPNIPDDDETTPLMNAVSQSRDHDMIHELVDRGADQSLTKKGQTVEAIAKKVGMEKELKPKSERSSIQGAIIDLVIALVMFVIAYTNNGIIKGVVDSVVSKLYGITGEKNDKLEQDINAANNVPKPDTVEAFQANLDTYVADTGLEKFFPPESRFLQSLADKAAKLRDDTTTDLGKPENVKRLTCLSLYQPIIYCDDSGSMAGENRFASQRELVTRIARIATKIVPDNLGVYLRFINANSTFGKSANQIAAEYDRHGPSGGTPIGISLRQKILQPLVYDVFARGGRLERPLLICAITDGSPGDGDAFKNEIINCRQKLLETGYESTAVRFCISQIGNDSAATAFLNGLRSDPAIKDVLHCTTDRLDDAFHKLRANERELEVWLLETLTRPIMSRYSD